MPPDTTSKSVEKILELAALSKFLSDDAEAEAKAKAETCLGLNLASNSSAPSEKLQTPQVEFENQLHTNFPFYRTLDMAEKAYFLKTLDEFENQLEFYFKPSFPFDRELAKILIAAAFARTTFLNSKGLLRDLKSISVYESDLIEIGNKKLGSFLYSLNAPIQFLREKPEEMPPENSFFSYLSKLSEFPILGVDLREALRRALEKSAAAQINIPKNASDTEIRKHVTALLDETSEVNRLLGEFSGELERISLKSEVSLGDPNEVFASKSFSPGFASKFLLAGAAAIKTRLDNLTSWSIAIDTSSNGYEIHLSYPKFLKGLLQPHGGGADHCAYQVGAILTERMAKNVLRNKSWSRRWEEANTHFDTREKSLLALSCSVFFMQPSVVLKNNQDAYHALTDLFGFVPPEMRDDPGIVDRILKRQQFEN